jgi:hypothetical protein
MKAGVLEVCGFGSLYAFGSLSDKSLAANSLIDK